MDKPAVRELKIHTEQYYVLSPRPPFVDLILSSFEVSRQDFERMAAMASSDPNDPRMVEMVRQAGDASAKVPYLMGAGETPESVLETLRGIARPQVERLHSLPAPMRSTIELLLSLHSVPHGCEDCCLPALLEIDRMQRAMIAELRTRMEQRPQAQDFRRDSLEALQALDEDWPRLREKVQAPWPKNQPLPKHSRMQFEAVLFNERFAHLHETCVIVASPHARQIRALTPPVLLRPLPESVPAPASGSADWLIREVGKIGRHFTRALLDIISQRLEAENLRLEARNYELINRRAQEALKEFIEKTP